MEIPSIKQKIKIIFKPATCLETGIIILHLGDSNLKIRNTGYMWL